MLKDKKEKDSRMNYKDFMEALGALAIFVTFIALIYIFAGYSGARLQATHRKRERRKARQPGANTLKRERRKAPGRKVTWSLLTFKTCIYR